MGKKYIVRLTAQEREVCQQTLRTLHGGSEKVRRAQILLKADADGPRWTDRQVAEAFSCRTKTVENIRQRCVLDGFEQALERKRRESPPVEKLLDGEQESQVIALRLGLRIPLMWNAESGDLERGFRRSGTLVGAQRRLVSQ